MRKGLIATLALTLVFGLAGYTLAQQGPPGGRPGMGPGQMGPGMMGQTGPGMWGQMGPGMMGGWGGYGMMGPGMGMMGPMMGSPEIMGTMMSIHGEIQSLMGQMMQKYGTTVQTSPEQQQQIQKEMMEGIGDILTKHGNALRQRAKAAGK